jgi:hypothetical protein
LSPTTAITSRPRSAIVELHPSLVIIVDDVRRAEEIEFYESALAPIHETGTDMISRVVEVDERGRAQIYWLPEIE